MSSSSNAALQSEDLSTIMGRATLVNGFVATAAGVCRISAQCCHTLRVSYSDRVEPIGGMEQRGFPFTICREWMLASPGMGCNLQDLVRKLWRWWRRRHSTDLRRHFPNSTTGGRVEDCCSWCARTVRLVHVFGLTRNSDPILLVLGLTQTIFEGSMYLFVFIWVPTLQESSRNPTNLPLGHIFSAFMVSMMLGSLLYTFITAHWFPPSSTSGLQKHARTASISSTPGDSSLVLHAQLSSFVCAAASVAFAACVSIGKGEGEHFKFWAFCLFEACVGMYYPVQGMLRGSLIANEHRATVSSLPFGYVYKC